MLVYFLPKRVCKTPGGWTLGLTCNAEHVLLTTKYESGPKWTVRKGESGRSLKWTVARKWTVRPKVDGLEPNWTVI